VFAASPSYLRRNAVALLVALLAVSAFSAVAASAASKGSARTQLLAQLLAGRRAEANENVQMGEILGIAAPGGGELMRIHSVYNNAKKIEATAMDVQTGLLRADAPSVTGINVQTVVFGNTGYIRPATASAKWTKETLQPTTKAAAALPAELLALAGTKGVTRLSAASGSSYRLNFHASDLTILRAFSSQVPAKALDTLSAKDKSLLSGLTFSFTDLVISVDAKGRLVQMKGGGILTETRADAKARGSFYPDGGVEGVVILNLFYSYGGNLTIHAPAANQVINPKKPIR
jgi:hypothetical protein